MSQILGTAKGAAIGVLMALVMAVLYLSGCAHRESRRSRDILECVFAAEHTPGLTDAQLHAVVARCGK